jgi:inner membrane protein
MSGFTIVYWHWFALAGVLLLPEMLMPGVAFLFLAIGAFATGVLKLVWSTASLDIQLGCFAVVSIAAFVGMRGWIRRIFSVRENDKINERGSQLVGQTITLNAAIRNGEGRVRVGDGSWNVSGPDMASGAKVRVVAVDGATLKVEPAP